MTTTREAAMEAALREAGDVIQSYHSTTGIDLGDASRMPFYADTIAKIDAALSTPATEPQGYVEGLGLKRIVEEVDGAMRHGTWRDAHGMRLKDTPEWVAFYNAIIGNATPATSDKIAEAARAAHEALWELNPDNYDHDDVLKLNDASVEAIFLLADAIGETHGKTPEWWEARRRALAGKGA